MRNNPIAVIDSGIGGLSLLKLLVKKYPNENYIYLADNEFMPYGNKSKSFIKARLFQLVEYLQQNFNVKMVILACNTASISALEYLNEKFDIEILGLNLNNYSNLKDYTIICTSLSKKGYPKLNCVSCSRLAQSIEDNYFDKQMLIKRIKKTVDKIENLQNLVLGCTHYELVFPLFKKITPTSQIILPCKDFVDNIQLKRPNLQSSGSVVMISTIPTKSYIDKLWKIFKN